MKGCEHDAEHYCDTVGNDLEDRTRDFQLVRVGVRVGKLFRRRSLERD